MLHLIGIGAKKEHINFEMFEIIKKSKKVFLEYYTSFYEDSFEDLEKFLNKKIEILDREDVEIKVEKNIILKAKNDDISFLVLGDPLVATTHTDLLLRCKKLGIKTKIYNNCSIANFITRCGLQFYKFGKITSIPFFNQKFMPRTPYLVFLENNKINAHSLFLLDLNPCFDKLYLKKDKFLSAKDALLFLLQIPKIMLENQEIDIKKTNILTKNSKAIICSRFGFKDEKIIYSNFEKLIEYDKKNNLKEPVAIIIPAKLHEIEEKFLKQFQI